ncbi:hypothetical protein GP486_000985 [Trichoglossum hirsutum]|uniref:Uncharacterized protein n=1 Tax=Trichoglossum hirsutum TaxID=265104 RepID=A0A9P8LHJ3_9PEZI|nr:hypothetical protein GP486_000985 [Trichoglossum hirsutum]
MPDPQDHLFEQVENYPWDQDADFQSGLEAILGPSPSPEQVQGLTLRARCFYYERKHNCPELKFDSYSAWRAQRNLPAVSDATSNSGSSRSPPTTTPSTSQNEPQAAASTSNSAPDPSAPYPNSFARIVDLITRGEPIPGIKHIPDTVLFGKESESRTAKRLKPWEKDGKVNVLDSDNSITTTLEAGGSDPKASDYSGTGGSSNEATTTSEV